MPEQCLIVDDEHTARMILESYIEKIDTLALAASCKNAIEAMNALHTHNISLIFLDINMPEISGLNFAKSIHKDIKVIFTTAYREYAVDGFDLQAVDYLLKPISFERFLKAVNKFLNEKITINHIDDEEIKIEHTDYIFVRSERKMIKINFDEICYIESLSDYIQIYLQNKKVICRDSIQNIEAKLPQRYFIRTHRSFIVSKNKIESYTNEYVELGAKQIPISRTYKDKVLANLT